MPDSKSIAIDENLATNTRPKGIELIQTLYLAIIAILPVALLFHALFYWVSASNFLEMLFTYLVYLGIYYGISRTKSWVITPTLLISYWGILRSFLAFSEQYQEISELIISRSINAFIIWFCVYQVIVFSKNETKKYFKSTGKEII